MSSSDAFFEQEAPVVALSPAEAGRNFANHSYEVQAEFLKAMSMEIQKWPSHAWPTQCDAIASQVPNWAREEVADRLEVLVNMLREAR
ncbi:hypothetical protein [Planctomyces sp. SH-PL14]|uniref:hypothetical protein n=1 Tax=Planctomyces sp. SH-PL14 TaxID=1632864 RepID=UPI0009462B56|nr:hypothetical protein [Planctomyces sp. SH-PL14]